MKTIKILFFTIMFCVICVTLYCCNNIIVNKKDLVGNWVCTGFSPDKEMAVFMSFNFSESDNVVMESAEKKLIGKYKIVGNNIICDFANSYEKKCVLSVIDFNGYKLDDMDDVADNTMVFDMYLDDKIYMQFECFRCIE